jgi:hypothetical protein
VESLAAEYAVWTKLEAEWKAESQAQKATSSITSNSKAYDESALVLCGLDNTIQAGESRDLQAEEEASKQQEISARITSWLANETISKGKEVPTSPPHPSHPAFAALLQEVKYIRSEMNIMKKEVKNLREEVRDMKTKLDKA